MRADFDGLPVAEATDVDYASKHSQLNAHGERVPTMHACGHDHHTTSLLGAMTVLDSVRDKWSGTVIALFQPAEEASIGAHGMVADGLTKAVPHPDVCLAQHVVAGRRHGLHCTGRDDFFDNDRNYSVRSRSPRIHATSFGGSSCVGSFYRDEVANCRLPRGATQQVCSDHCGVGGSGQGK